MKELCSLGIEWHLAYRPYFLYKNQIHISTEISVSFLGLINKILLPHEFSTYLNVSIFHAWSLVTQNLHFPYTDQIKDTFGTFKSSIKRELQIMRTCLSST